MAMSGEFGIIGNAEDLRLECNSWVKSDGLLPGNGSVWLTSNRYPIVAVPEVDVS